MMGEYVTTGSDAGICSVDGGCIGYVMAPTVSDSGGPNDELDTTENGRGGPLLLLLLLLVGVVVVGPADELVGPGIDGPPLEGMMLSV